MDFLIGGVIGFVIGWIVFQRPQWATDSWLWLRAKVFRSPT